MSFNAVTTQRKYLNTTPMGSSFRKSVTITNWMLNLQVSLHGHWCGFISRNYVVWPIFLLMNVFIALKGTHFWFLFTSDLTWRSHISNITTKANRILNRLRRHLCGCNQAVKSRAFTSLVRHLEYSSLVWDPYFKQDILAVENVQRKGARFVTSNYSYRESVTSMLDSFQLFPLQETRRARRLTHFYKATNNLSPVKKPNFVTASSAFDQLQTNYEHYKHSFLSRTIREWNTLPRTLCTL